MVPVDVAFVVVVFVFVVRLIDGYRRLIAKKRHREDVALAT